MSFFDIFTGDNARDAAEAQKQGLRDANTAATNAVNTGYTNANNYFAAALAPWTAQLQTMQPGATAYANATGANGQAGMKAAQDAFLASPGYTYQVQQGTENALRNAARTGSTASGDTMMALNNVAQGQAKQDWNQYVQNLLPFLQGSNTAAAGASGVSTNQAINAQNVGNTLAQYGWNENTGIGNAQANADLAKNAASANIWSAIMGGLGLGANMLGFSNGGLGTMMGLTGGATTPKPTGTPAPTGWTPYGIPNWALSK